MKLPRIKARKLVSFLKEKGFEEIKQSGSHLKMKNPEGRIVIVPIHSQSDIPAGTLLSILRQAGLSKEDLIGYFG